MWSRIRRVCFTLNRFGPDTFWEGAYLLVKYDSFDISWTNQSSRELNLKSSLLRGQILNPPSEISLHIESWNSHTLTTQRKNQCYLECALNLVSLSLCTTHAVHLGNKKASHWLWVPVCDVSSMALWSVLCGLCTTLKDRLQVTSTGMCRAHISLIDVTC